MTKKGKLELTWVGKDERLKLEPRVLVEDPAKSYGDPNTENMLIYGDNLLALKALEQDFTGKIKCIYVDPPYNAKQALNELYDDNLEHSQWLSLMRDRFEMLRTLLRKDGIFFCQLNDDEMAYGKILLDEIFGRSNYLNQVSVKMKQTAGASGGGEDKRLKKNIEYILIYARDKDGDGGFTKFNDVYDEEDLFEVIAEMEEEGKSWKYTRILRDLGHREYLTTIEDGAGEPIKIYSHSSTVIEPITKVAESEGISEQECYIKYFDKIIRDTNAQSSIRTRVMEAVIGKGDFFSIEYVPKSGRNKGQQVTLYYKGAKCDLIAWLKDIAVKKGNRILKMEKAGTYWEGFPLNNLTKEGGVQFPHGKKPEALIKKILELATAPGDFVLDSFAGSGTTGAVAHKMGRRWIMCELGEHCHTHIIPRMKAVIDGTDQGGISKAVNWKGGGGFKYYRLAESLLVRDKELSTNHHPVYIINPRYDEKMLIRAICKIGNFRYRNEGRLHGISSESRFLHVTTNLLTQVYLDSLAEDIGQDQSLLIYCTRKRNKLIVPDNVEIKKIPRDLLSKCDFQEDK